MAAPERKGKTMRAGRMPLHVKSESRHTLRRRRYYPTFSGSLSSSKRPEAEVMDHARRIPSTCAQNMPVVSKAMTESTLKKRGPVQSRLFCAVERLIGTDRNEKTGEGGVECLRPPHIKCQPHRARHDESKLSQQGRLGEPASLRRRVASL